MDIETNCQEPTSIIHQLRSNSKLFPKSTQYRNQVIAKIETLKSSQIENEN